MFYCFENDSLISKTCDWHFLPSISFCFINIGNISLIDLCEDSISMMGKFSINTDSYCCDDKNYEDAKYWWSFDIGAGTCACSCSFMIDELLINCDNGLGGNFEAEFEPIDKDI